MKASRFYGKHNILIENVEIRPPGVDEVMIKIHYCGICGTDAHIFEGDKGSMEITEPRILGHEFSGEVAEIGRNVSHVKVGDRVSSDVNFSCGHCRFCASGKNHLCDELTGLGTVLDGGFAEYIVVKKEAVYKLPEKVSYESAAMIEPISCCLHGMDLTDVKLGDVVMIIGAGSIGLIMIQLCKHAGASKIIVVEPLENRRKISAKLAANILINPDIDDTSELLNKEGIKNIDKVIDCAGLINTAEYALKHAGKGSTVMLFGLTKPDEELKIKPFSLFQKEITIKSSFVNPNAFERSLRLLEAEIVKTDDIITDIFTLDEIQTVFKNKLYLKNGKALIKIC